MTERRYTLAEIDAMREALMKRHWIQDIVQGETIREMFERYHRRDLYVESVLRTHMMNGTEPSELIGPEHA